MANFRNATQPLFFDYFKRRNGAPDKLEFPGSTTVLGSAGTWTISTNRLQLPFSSMTLPSAWLHPSFTYRERMIRFKGKFSFDTVPTTSNETRMGFMIYSTPADQVEFVAECGNGLITRKVRHVRTGGTDTYGSSTFAYSANQAIWIMAEYDRGESSAGVIRLKIWLDGTAEPAAWNVDTTLSASSDSPQEGANFGIFAQQVSATSQGNGYCHEARADEVGGYYVFRDTFNRDTFNGSGFWSPPNPDEPGNQGYGVYSGVGGGSGGTATAYVLNGIGVMVAPGSSSTIRYVRHSTATSGSGLDTFNRIGIPGDFDVRFKVRLRETGTMTAGTAAQAGFMFDYNSTTSDGRYVSIGWYSSGLIFLRHGSIDGGVWTERGSSPAGLSGYAAGDYWWVHVQRHGETIRMRTWDVGDSTEPPWQYEFNQYTTGIDPGTVPGWGWWCQNTDVGDTINFAFADITISAPKQIGPTGVGMAGYVAYPGSDAPYDVGSYDRFEGARIVQGNINDPVLGDDTVQNGGQFSQGQCDWNRATGTGLLVAVVTVYNASTAPTITTPGGWTLIRSTTDGTDIRTSIYARTNSSGRTTELFNFSKSGDYTISMFEFAGTNSSATITVVIDHDTGTGNSSSTPQSGEMGATSNPSLLLGAVAYRLPSAGTKTVNSTPFNDMIYDGITDPEWQLIGGGTDFTGSLTFQVAHDIYMRQVIPESATAYHFGAALSSTQINTCQVMTIRTT